MVYSLRRLKAIYILSIFGLLTSCGVSSVNSSLPIEINSIVSGTAERYLVAASQSDTSRLFFSFQLYSNDPISANRHDEIYKDSVNTKIYNFVQRFTEFEREEEQGTLTAGFFQTQLDSFVSIYREEEDEYSILWELEGGVSINDNYESFVALDFHGWTFTGGAHGNGFSTTHMIAKQDGSLLNLKDFISNISELNSIAEPIFRKLYNLLETDDLDQAGFWFEKNIFSVNNNFYFSENKMVFYYNSYEIAPYSGGPTELAIPLAKIKHLLTRQI